MVNLSKFSSSFANPFAKGKEDAAEPVRAKGPSAEASSSAMPKTPRKKPASGAVTANFISRERSKAFQAHALGVSNPENYFRTSDELALVKRQRHALQSDAGSRFHELLQNYLSGDYRWSHAEEVRANIALYSVDIAAENQAKRVYYDLCLPSDIIKQIKNAPSGIRSRKIAHQLVHGFRLRNGGYTGRTLATVSSFAPASKASGREAAIAGEQAVNLQIKVLGANVQRQQTGARGVTVREAPLPAHADSATHQIVLDPANRYEIESVRVTSKNVLECKLLAYGALSAKEAALPKATDKWVQESRRLGSNSGGVFRDPEGQSWYVKQGSENHIKNEHLALMLYEAMGQAVPASEMVTRGGKLALASKMLDVSAMPMDEPVQGLKSGFVVDAWLANWDVIGRDYDNLKVDQHKHAVRIDAGGALRYRAQGTPKGPAFGNRVTEIMTLLDGTNDQSRHAFRDLTKADILAGIAQLAQFEDSAIRMLCMGYGPGKEAEKEDLANILIDRKKWLLAKLDENFPYLHERQDEHGRIVTLKHPSKPTAAGSWLDAASTAVAVTGARPAFPERLNGVAFSSWDAPGTVEGWRALEPEVDFKEQPMRLQNGLRAASGVMIIEPDGRLWIAEPSNHAFKTSHSFPKGKLEEGLRLKCNAIKETFEETGLQVKLTGLLGDYARKTSITRYYIGERIGGKPADMGWESQSVKLVPLDQAHELFALDSDKKILADLRQRLEATPDKAGARSGSDVSNQENASAAQKTPRPAPAA